MRNFLLLSCLMLASINASAYNAPGKWQMAIAFWQSNPSQCPGGRLLIRPFTAVLMPGRCDLRWRATG